MKHYYKATVQYDGTGYAGFQWQKDIPSIQNDFNLALGSIIEGKITTMGASRTDTGVHAMGQVVKVTSENLIDCSSIVHELNMELPLQIKCLKFVPCEGNFRPETHPTSKEYRYYFTNHRNVPPEERRFISNFSLPLNIEVMKTCLSEIIGAHDFQNFCSAGSNVKSTTREIYFCELIEIDPHTALSHFELMQLPKELSRCYQLRIEGNGFLKQMIRHIVSALWMAGSGRLTKEDFVNQLKGPKREKRIWKVAPPNGLFLYEIKYLN